VHRSIAWLVPRPGQKTSSQGVPAISAARMVGRPRHVAARRRLQRSVTSSAPSGLPRVDRKKRLGRLPGRRRVGIVLNEHTDDDGAPVFQQACRMGLEGIVSMRLGAAYRSGPSRDWIKVKNPDSPAMIRVRDGEW
jgi:hypothetical protein